MVDRFLKSSFPCTCDIDNLIRTGPARKGKIQVNIRACKMKDYTDMRSPGFLGYKTPVSLQAQKEEIKRLKEANQFISGVFGEFQYIQELIGLNDNIARVEDLETKVQKAYQKIQKHLTQYEQAEAPEQGQQAKVSGDSIPIEAHPELQDMGGMPLELDKLDKEFLDELGLSDILDKTEIENQLKKKLRNRLELANKLQNDLKSQPRNRPTARQANELVVKYKMAMEDLKKKPVLEPEVPQYTPRYEPPKPRPGQG